MVTYYWRLVDSSGQFIYSDIDADLGSNATVLVHHLYTRECVVTLTQRTLLSILSNEPCVHLI